MLFAVREAVAGGHDFADEQRIVLLGLIAEGDAGRPLRLGGEGLLLFVDGGVGLGVDERQSGLAADGMVGGVEDAGRQLCLVAHADKAWHVGLNHDVLLGHGLGTDVAVQHVGGVGNAHESPRGQTFGQREAEHHLSVLVGLQGGIAEGGLLQVFAHLHLLGLLSVGIVVSGFVGREL